MHRQRFSALLLLISFIFYPLLSARGFVGYYENNSEFNQNNLVPDSFITDYNSMTAEQIREFAINQGGTLASYIDPEVKLPAYFIIWQTAQEFQINPKFILTMLQKEQSLVTNDSPTQNQYDWAVGYTCYGGICLDEYRGFSRQIRGMADRFIFHYLADLDETGKYKNGYNCTFTKWCVGNPTQTQDEQLIIPQNKATCALYTYNPYRGGTIMEGLKIGANYNFWKIWNNWFKTAKFRPESSLLKSQTSDVVYLIQDGKKRPFKNFAALITRYNPENIIVVDQGEINQYETGAEIKFSQYSLLATENGDLYMVDGDNLRKFASQEVFSTLGFNPEEVENVTIADLADLPRGRDIDINSSYPTGALIQEIKSGGIYFVQNGIKYPIFSREIMSVNFPGQTPLKGRQDELDKYPKGEAIKFKDGTLVKSKDSDVVYVIAKGKKLTIASAEAFISRGYAWNKIVVTNQAAIDIHPTGETLEKIDFSRIPQTNIQTVTPTNTPVLTNPSTSSTSTLE